jgi:Uma2 family endonuclease
MTTVATNAPPAVGNVLPPDWTLADLLAHLGGIPPERIRMFPYPGTATENDVTELDDHQDRLCELIDGVLVEKTLGYLESIVAIRISYMIMAYLDTHDLGLVAGEGGMLKILPSQVRIPDVSFIAWDRLPNHKLPDKPISALAPDLAIEVLSPSNTPGEMRRKLHDYFTAGVRLVWYVDPHARTATVYEAEDRKVELGEAGSLSGGDLLPGFELSLATLFANASRRAEG